MRRNLHRSPSRGFTLIELVVAISILAILAGMAMPAVVAFESGEMHRAADLLLGDLVKAARAFTSDLARIPDSLDEFTVEPTGMTRWLGPYLTVPVGTAIVDPWQSALQYTKETVSTGNFRCAGDDRQLGTTDDLVLRFSVAPELREITRLQVDRINVAILAWNSRNLPDQPLPPNIDGTVAQLVANGYLPAGPDWSRDAFGQKLQTSAAPVTSVYATG